MANTYDSQIFADKLTKLTISQGCIESISHWCVAHIKHAKKIVQTWNRQFHSAAHKQKLALLYLANDILQNSRRRGAEFVTEFWKVLPDSLNDVTENGDEVVRRQALRLIDIWVERSVFGSKSQILKENYMKRNVERNSRPTGFQMKTSIGNALDKITSGFQAVYGSQLDEDVISRKCRNAIYFIEGVDKGTKVGGVYGSTKKKLKGQHAILRDCIEQLRVVKSSREHLVTLLRDALQEEENKLNQVRDLVKEAEEHSKQAESFSSLLFGTATSSASGQVLVTHSGSDSRQLPSSSDINTQQWSPIAEKPEESLRLGAAATSSSQLQLIGSSNVHESATDDSPFAKRARIDTDRHHHHPSNIPTSLPTSMQPPTPPSSPPPTPPPPTQPYDQVQYPQTAMPIPRGPYGYGFINRPRPPLYPSYRSGFTFAPPSNVYYSYSYGQPPSQPPRRAGPW